MRTLHMVFITACIVFISTSCGSVSGKPLKAAPIDRIETPLQIKKPTQTFIATPIDIFEPTSQPTQTLSPTINPTPDVVIRRLLDGGCCVQPFWSPDGKQILYIDRPSAQDPTGLWSVGLDGSAPEFFTDRLGIYSADMRKIAFLQGGQTVVEELSSGERWIIPSGGRAVSFSPDGEWLAWTSGESGPPFDTAKRDIWVSRSDGTDARNLVSVIGGGFAGWFPDGRLLISGRLDTPVLTQVYWVLRWDRDGAKENKMSELGRGNRLRNPQISPDGTWLVYLTSLNEDPAEDGLWLVDSTNGEKTRLDLFGAYSWRDANRLLIIPLDLTNPMHYVMQFEVNSGHIEQLTHPSSTPFRIANGDWSISPDGNHIAFLSAEDRNIWLLTLSR